MRDSLKQPGHAGTEKNNEIEITPAMIDAGVEVVCDYGPDRVSLAGSLSEYTLVERIISRALSHRKKSP